jgi:hypothetical protein
MKKCQNILKFSKKYINKFIHKITYTRNWLKTIATNIHNWCVDNKTYKLIVYECGVIVLNGFFIWIMLFPFLDYNPVWFIPSYGIIPWFIIQFKQEWYNK